MKIRKKQAVRVGFFITSLIGACISVTAQTGAIRGKITDNKQNEACIGASIVVKEIHNKGANPDFDGNYIIDNLPAGTYTVVASYFSHQTITKTTVVVQSGKETIINFVMIPDETTLETVTIVARVNRESEVSLMLEQREALVSTQLVGARELSRKGIGDAQAAVAQVSGISKQEGVKNVFVRGLGDRYNATLLNGFPIPSEDPEYKNIALEFFGTDVIQSIGVSKVFSARDYSDVGGAVINISSKELVGNYALGVDISAGVNTSVIGKDFLRQDGSNYWGFAGTQRPMDNTFTFANSLAPSIVPLPVNHGFGVAGGKSFRLGEKRNPLSFFVVASHGDDYSYTKESMRSANTVGTVYKDQTGYSYSQNTHQLVLGNVIYGINQKHNVQYNCMLIHANDQYVGEYKGFSGADYEDSPYNSGVLRRQQSNDNLLLTNQLMSDWTLAERLKFDAGVSYNKVTGNEPDRRVNNFSQQADGLYSLTRSYSHQRFFSELTDNDLNAKTVLTYKLKDTYNTNNSALKTGYSGRFSKNNFEAVEYSYTHIGGEFDLDDLKLDDWYNETTQAEGKFRMKTGPANTYFVTKNVHSAFAEASYQLLQNVTGNVGFRMDIVDMAVDYHVQTTAPGTKELNKNFFLPSLNLKYTVNEKNTLRFGASKTYTLPQSKEISPYQYVDMSFVSQGNPHLKPSDNYNADLKWDYYMSSGELFSLTGFYKHIVNPIGRVDEANAANMLTYGNISNRAAIAGVEMEVRKNIFSTFDIELETTNKLTAGLNASFIYTRLELDIPPTPTRSSGLEGASPFLCNADLSYSYTKQDKNVTASIVFKYFSNRIYTTGTRGFNDIIEEGVPTLDFTASYKFDKHFSAKIKAANLFDASYRLTRETTSGEKIVLNEYKKGQSISVGLSYEF